MSQILCACGCGTLIDELDKRGRKRKMVVGHGNKNKSNFWKKKEIVKKRTLHTRNIYKLIH
jgi:hypothetical protein